MARGVVGLITPWNFRVAIPLRALFPALLAGNAVIWKPSEFTARVAEPIAHAALEAFGPNVVTLVQGGGDLGAALVGSGIDAVVFTGSVRTGRAVAKAAAEALIPAGLELGGKDAAVVLDDADLERTARGIVWGALINAGQNCASIERVYVHEKVAKALVDRMVALTRELRVGEDVGPLTTQAQLDIVVRHVDGAKELGAEILCGGKATGKGLLFEPTIVKVEASEETRFPLITEETFGPVLPVVVVKSEEEAITRANDSRYGLTASIWTKKTSRGEQLAERLRAGVVTVNNHGFTAAIAAAPWSGVGDSGFGVTNSKHALREFTRPRFVLVDKSSAKSELWWMPYTPSLVATVKAMSILRSGTRSLGEKFRALIMLLSNAPKRLMGK